MLNLPEIDLKSTSAKSEFCDSIAETGFAIIKNSSFSFKKLEKLYSIWNAFFSSDKKFSYPYNADQHEGYYPFCINSKGEKKVIGLMESFYFTTESIVDVAISQITRDIMIQLHGIMLVLIRWLAEYSNIVLNANINDIDKCCYRIMHYPPLSGTVLDKEISDYFNLLDRYPAHGYRLEPHKDYSYITLLPKDKPCSGLEIMDYKTNQWLKIGECSEECIVINTGNSMQLASNGLLRSTLHKVSLPSKEAWDQARYSSAFFV